MVDSNTGMLTIMQRKVRFFKNSDYGFLNDDPYPKGFTTSQLKGKAENHCASIAAANSMMILGCLPSDEKSLKSVYKEIGNGPVIFLKRKMVNSYGHLISCHTINTQKIKLQTLHNENLILLCLPLSIVEWHWIVIVDSKIIDAEVIFKIYDGWNAEPRYLRQTDIKWSFGFVVKKNTPL